MPNEFRFLKLVPLFIVLGIITLVLLSLRPIPKSTHSNTSKQSGVVRQVLDGAGKNDIVIELQNDPHYYYVNRGIERGLSAKALHHELKGRRIDFVVGEPLDAVGPGFKVQAYCADPGIGEADLFRDQVRAALSG